jgi:hypothetical protein
MHRTPAIQKKRKGLILLVSLSSLCGVKALEAQDLGHIEDAKPVTLHGSFATGLNYYGNLSADGTNPNGTSFGTTPSWFLQADPVLSIYGVAIPMSLLLTSQDERFSAPFNRYGMSPYYKWAKLHLGWRSLNFSRFTLAGQQILGAGFELTPGKFTASFMFGKFNNAITDVSLFNNLNNYMPLYERKGYAARIGYGSKANFIEFSYLQAKDDSTSIPKALVDSARVRPAANQVLGVNTKVTVHKHISVHVEAAASYYTRSTTATLRETDEQWSQYAAVFPRISSRGAVAGEASIQQQVRDGSIHLKYKRVDPDYKSMGAFYMQTDLEQYTLGADYAFLKKKVEARGELGFQHNNLYQTSFSDSRRTIGNVSVNILPSQTLGVQLQYSNYGISQQIIPQLQNPDAIVRYDSIRISQVNQSFSVAPHLYINRKTVQHSISAQASIQALNNRNEAQAGQDYTSTMGSLIYALVLSKQHLTISNTLNYFSTAMSVATTTTMGYNLGISKKLMADTSARHTIEAVTLSLYGGYFATQMDGASSGHVFSLNPAVGITFLKRHSFQLNANWRAQRSKAIISSDNQVTLAARYNFSF